MFIIMKPDATICFAESLLWTILTELTAALRTSSLWARRFGSKPTNHEGAPYGVIETCYMLAAPMVHGKAKNRLEPPGKPFLRATLAPR